MQCDLSLEVWISVVQNTTLTFIINVHVLIYIGFYNRLGSLFFENSFASFFSPLIESCCLIFQGCGYPLGFGDQGYISVQLLYGKCGRFIFFPWVPVVDDRMPVLLLPLEHVERFGSVLGMCLVQTAAPSNM